MAGSRKYKNDKKRKRAAQDSGGEDAKKNKPTSRGEQNAKTKKSKVTLKLSAVKKVINITELLENILVNLDMRTLLLSRRVNRRFKVTIDGSSVLQQALFFKLAPVDGRHFGEDGVNTLLTDTRAPFDKKRPGPYLGFRVEQVGEELSGSEKDFDDADSIEGHPGKDVYVKMSFHNMSKAEDDGSAAGGACT